MGHQALVTQFMGEVIEDVRKVRLVLHHQDTARIEGCLETVIGETRDLLDQLRRCHDRRNPVGYKGR
ncbi:hypothetical protein D3C76_1656960 [compost metagenome]